MSNNSILYLISIISYMVALTQKLFTTSGEVLNITFKKDSYTFFKSIDLLQSHGYEVLSYILLVFVIGLPILKYFTILLNMINVKVINNTINDFILYLQKYAMIDVFVIALILIASKSNPLFVVRLEIGTYALMVSVLSGILLSINLKFFS